MSTITKGATVLTPELVLGYRATRQYGNSVSPIVNDDDVDVTYEPAGLRSGTLSLLLTDAAAGFAMDALHLLSGTFAFADATTPAMNMTYIPVGKCELELDPRTRRRWIFTVDFQEVS